jgi:4'-phosphopantetheinyl transferase
MLTSSATIQTGEVHVWSLSFSDAEPDIAILNLLLSDDEQARAVRFISDNDRTRFIVARGVLRQLLSVYTGHPARSIQLVYGRHGRPALTASQTHNINFNLSHSGEHALFALSREGEVGIDVERIRPYSPGYRLRLAKRFFSELEFSALQGLSTSCVEQAFFACWTRKEAYIKAHGRGLSLPLSQFSVSVNPISAPQLLATPWCPSDLKQTRLWDLAVPRGYHAAIALKKFAGVPEFRLFAWSAKASPDL